MKKVDYIKVGIFVFLSGVIFLVFVISLGDKKFLTKKKEIIVEFNSISGLKEYSPVKVLGVDVGFVRRVKLNIPKKRVLVYLNIRKDVSLPVDSLFFINTLGLFGEKYLEIIPGNEKKEIRSGEIVKGEEFLDFYTMFKNFFRFLNNFSSLANSAKKILEDKDLKTEFEKLLKNLNQATQDLNVILEDLRNRKGTLGKILFEDELYNNINELITDLKENPWKLLRKPKKKKKRYERKVLLP